MKFKLLYTLLLFMYSLPLTYIVSVYWVVFIVTKITMTTVYWARKLKMNTAYKKDKFNLLQFISQNEGV